MLLCVLVIVILLTGQTAKTISVKTADKLYLDHVEDMAKLIVKEWEAEFGIGWADHENEVLYNGRDEIVFQVADQYLEICNDLKCKAALWVFTGNDFMEIVSNVHYIDPLSENNNLKFMSQVSPDVCSILLSNVNNATYTGRFEIYGEDYYGSYCPMYSKNGELLTLAFSGMPYSVAKKFIDSQMDKYMFIILVSCILGFIGVMYIVLLIIKVDLTQKINSAVQILISAVKSIGGYAISINDAGNSFARDSQEQAGSIEEISASIEETTSMISQTSEGATETSQLTSILASSVHEGNEKMIQMTSTINSIKESSDEIEKVIKLIDDIASQTNILALNAAVEAARAGDAGKGFAVVAEEVRNLAQKSAEAAKNSANIIERNIALSNEGVNVAELVNQALVSIAEGVEKVRIIASESANATGEEVKGMEQVSHSMKIIEKTTAGTAEKAQQNVEYSKALQVEMQKVEQSIQALNKILGQ